LISFVFPQPVSPITITGIPTLQQAIIQTDKAMVLLNYFTATVESYSKCSMDDLHFICYECQNNAYEIYNLDS